MSFVMDALRETYNAASYKREMLDRLSEAIDLGKSSFVMAAHFPDVNVKADDPKVVKFTQDLKEMAKSLADVDVEFKRRNILARPFMYGKLKVKINKKGPA